MDQPVEMRELVHFVALAEDMHFSRAAERLGIAQPALSREISRLERRMGVQLFERTSRRVSLTQAGSVFLRESRKALAAVNGAVSRAQQAARPQRLVIAAPPGTGAAVLSPVLEAYRHSADPAPVQVLFTTDLAAGVRDGTADLALMCGTRAAVAMTTRGRRCLAVAASAGQRPGVRQVSAAWRTAGP